MKLNIGQEMENCALASKRFRGFRGEEGTKQLAWEESLNTRGATLRGYLLEEGENHARKGGERTRRERGKGSEKIQECKRGEPSSFARKNRFVLIVLDNKKGGKKCV